MQLGARWQVGHAPHRSVPLSLHALISEQEAVHPQAASWTLTWLEGRPRCALEDLVIVTLTPAGAPTVEVGPGQASQPGIEPGTGHAGPATDDDDDDWLS